MAHVKKMKLWGGEENPRCKMIKMVADVAGVELEFPKFTMGDTNKTPEFLKMNPMGKVPVLEIPGVGALSESQAIAVYIANQDPKKTLLFPGNDFKTAQMHQWMDFAATNLGSIVMGWVYPILGFAPYNPTAEEMCKEALKRSLGALNSWLETRTYLAGERLSLADLTVANVLGMLYKMVVEPRMRNPFPNVNRWLETIAMTPCVLTNNKFDPSCWCVVARQAQNKDAPKAAAPAPAKEEKKAEEKPAEEEKKDEKPKDPLAALPKSSFVLDEFKREFSNNPVDVWSKFLWDNFDADGYTLWWANYKYNAENSKIFMSSNLIGGYFQRLDRMRKHAFGALGVYGEDGAHDIKGFWLIRNEKGATTLPAQMTDVDDTELYEWTQLDAKNVTDEQKALIVQYLTGENIDGKEYADGKIFK